MTRAYALAVAPNGARRTHADHPALPMTPEQQIATVHALRPEAISVALREVLPDAAHAPAAEAFFEWLWQENIVTQYILYDAEDVAHYWRLRAKGAIRPGRHWVLFVLGRYSKGQLSAPSDLLPFLSAWQAGGERADATPWAMCAFGPREAECALATVLQGGHARIGFENNPYLPDGSVSPGNAASLDVLRAAATPLALAPMCADALRELTR